MVYNDWDKILVAHYYYEVGLKQQEIAEKLGMSRQRVNRLLKQALEESIVEIRIPRYEDAVLENKLKSKLGLKNAIVVDSDNISKFNTATLNYLDSIVCDGSNIGVSGGMTIAKLCNPQASFEKHDVNVVQLMGGINASDNYQRPDEITYKLAQIFGGKAHILLAPAIVDNPNLSSLLMKDRQFKNVHALYPKLNIAIISVGTINEESLLFRVGYFKEDDFRKLREKNGIGEVLMHFIDINGNIVDTNFDERIIGISADEFKKIAIRIGVSYGPAKVKPLIAAINGKFINVLITDSYTAKALLEFKQ